MRLFFMLVVLCLPVTTIAQEELPSLHFLGAQWAVSAQPSPFADIVLGFQQSDITPDPENANQLLGSNACGSSAVIRSFPGVTATTNEVRAVCEEAITYPLVNGGEAFVLPGGSVGEVVVDDVEVTIDRSAYARDSRAYSAARSKSRAVGESFGFEQRGFNQYFTAPVSADASIDDLAGDWAITRLEVEVVSDQGEVLYTVLTFPAMLTTRDGGSIEAPAGTEFIESEFRTYVDGSPVEKRRFETTTEDEDIAAPFTVSPDGSIEFVTGDRGQPGRNPQVMEGFSAPSGDFFVLAEGVPGIASFRDGDDSIPDISSFAAHQWFLGIRRNANPSLDGRRYRLKGLTFYANSEAFELGSWTHEAFIEFDADGVGRWYIDTDLLRVPFGNGQGTGIETDNDSILVDVAWSMADDGRITVQPLVEEGIEQSLINGYATPDNEVMLFSHALSLDGGAEGEIGYWLAECINCNPETNINVGHSGAWFNPETPGQGQLIDVEPAGEFLFLSWFTYTDAAAADSNEQHWFTAQGNYTGNNAELVVYETLGGQFDDPKAVSTQAVGSATLHFSKCETGQLDYTIDSWDLQGSFVLQRAIPGTENVCNVWAGLSDESIDPNDGRDGAWFDKASPGQGFLIDAQPDNEFIFVAWFTYGEETVSGQRWLTAQGSLVGTSADLIIYETLGGSFDNPNPSETNAVGTMTIDFTDCSNAQLDYSITDEALAGTIDIERAIPGTEALCEEFSQ